MRRALSFLAAVALLIATTSTPTLAQDEAADGAKSPELLFVMSGMSGSADADSLMLDGVPAVVFFSDRPARQAGHLSVPDFAAAWGIEDSDFTADPPNAVLSILGDVAIEDIVVELTSIEIGGDDSVSFGYRHIDGQELPVEFGPASLFVDDYFYDCSGSILDQDGAICSLP